MMIDYKKICGEVCDIARRAGGFIRDERLGFSVDRIEYKGINDLVSYVDKGAERMIVSALKAMLPEASFITEEKTVETDASAPLKWIIDPLDGTTNFVHGFPPYCVSIALMEGSEVVVGVVYEITQNECFYAWTGGAAYLDGSPIRVSETATLADSLVITGVANGERVMMTMFMEMFEYFMINTHGARRIGSAATDLVYVAAARADAFWHTGLSPWDVAAGAFIVEQAGGRVCDFSGGRDYIFGREIIAANVGVMDEFKGVIETFVDKYKS